MTDKLVLGTVQLGLPYGVNNQTGKPSQDEVFKILHLAHDSGIDTLDTAEAYGDSHKLIGLFHSITGKRFKVISKLNGTVEADVFLRFEKITGELAVPALYTGMIHQFAAYYHQPEIVEAFLNAKARGIVKRVGVSIYSNDEIDTICDDERIDVVQMPFNLLDNRSKRNDAMLRLKNAGKEIHVRSVFLQGLFFKTDFHHEKKYAQLFPYIKTLQRLCGSHELTISELAIQYALQNPLIDKILIGVETTAQLRDNLTQLNRHVKKDIFDLVDQINVREDDMLNPSNWK